jgi:hypothetical protein
MRRVNFKWVPHALDSSQQAFWVQVLRVSLSFLESGTGRSLLNVYTGAETWMGLDDFRTSMWIGADVTRPTGVRRTVAPKKRMFWINFSQTVFAAVVMPGNVLTKTSSLARCYRVLLTIER